MTANIATSEPADPAADSGADNRATTPLFNHLMTMIDETAVENRHVSHHLESPARPLPRIAAAPRPGLNWSESSSGFVEPRWSVGQLLTYAAGAITVIAIIGAAIGSLGRLGQAPAVVAGSASDIRTEARVASGPEGGTGVKVTARPDAEGVKTVSVKTISVKAATAPASATPEAPAPKVEAPVSKADTSAPQVEAPAPKAEAPALKIEAPAPRADASTPKADALSPKVDAPAVRQAAVPDTTGTGDAPASKQPQVAAAAAKEPAEDPIETGSIETGETTAKAPTETSAPIGTSRIVSDVRLRAGPGNSHAVLGTVPKGATVDVVGCRAWCEIVADGQHGWVYKGFVEAPEAFAVSAN